MVEHDLAKVGVASSNLVSRSIFLLFLLLGFLYSKDYVFLKQNYCVDGIQTVDSRLISQNVKKEFFIFDLPKNRASYRVPSLKILSKFKKNDINITDLSNGTVLFKNCNIPLDIKFIKKMLKKKFKEKFPSIEIKSISITSLSSLQPKLSFYQIQDIKVAASAYRRAKGTLSVRLAKGEDKKMIYLKFEIDATISIFKANYNLRNGKILQKDDYIKRRVKFDKLRMGVITGRLQKNYIVKGYVKKGTILNINHFRAKKDMLRGEYIKAVFRNGNLVLETDAHLLNDANIGDTVRIKTSSGKTLRAKIISLKTAKILE